MEFTLQATAVLPVSLPEAFAVITDIERLPDWNLEIPKIVESPAVLEVGSEWVVTIHAMKTRWNSRSRVTEIDAARGVFTYRSQSDDGNPSYADWRWQLNETPAGTRVHVEVDIRPRTFMRKALFSRIRKSSLEKAVQHSLVALGELVTVQ
jgi:hypothetical protein